MPSKPWMPRLVRKVTLATITTAAIALLPGVAHAALEGDWQMTDKGAPPATMTDTSGFGNNGSPSGGIVGNGNVFTFDGSGVVVVPANAELDPGDANVTITAVISFTQIPARDYDIVRKKPAGVKGMQYRMEINKYGKAKCFFTGSTGNAAITAKRVLNDGQQHTIACTKTSSTIGVSVDGTVKTKAVTIGSISNGFPISVGGKADGGDNFVGSMDSVQVNYT
jgi:Concanavalin A-like lectin/glucanases superfamily